jgi:hypothetical protein
MESYFPLLQAQELFEMEPLGVYGPPVPISLSNARNNLEPSAYPWEQ